MTFLGALERNSVSDLSTKQFGPMILFEMDLHVLYITDKVLQYMIGYFFVTLKCSISYINSEDYKLLLFTESENMKDARAVSGLRPWGML